MCPEIPGLAMVSGEIALDKKGSILIVLPVFYPQYTTWAELFLRSDYLDIGTLVVFGVLLAGLVLSILKLRKEFFLGGIFCGVALLYSIGWLNQLIVQLLKHQYPYYQKNIYRNLISDLCLKTYLKPVCFCLIFQY